MRRNLASSLCHKWAIPRDIQTTPNSRGTHRDFKQINKPNAQPQPDCSNCRPHPWWSRRRRKGAIKTPRKHVWCSNANIHGWKDLVCRHHWQTWPRGEFSKIFKISVTRYLCCCIVRCDGKHKHEARAQFWRWAFESRMGRARRRFKSKHKLLEYFFPF
jgi:hypothetical protein